MFVVASQQLGQGKTVLGEEFLGKLKSLVEEGNPTYSNRNTYPPDVMEAVINAYYVKLDMAELGMS